MSAVLENGKYFGYPSCCVTFFQENHGEPRWYESHLEKYPIAFSKLNGTGFIPCPSCMEKLEKGADINSLIENRECPAPFPYGPEELAFNLVGKLMRERGLKKTMEFFVWLHNAPV